MGGKYVCAHFFHFSVDETPAPKLGLCVHEGLVVIEGFVEYAQRQ